MKKGAGMIPAPLVSCRKRSLVPAVGVADFDHGAEDGVPGLGVFEDGVVEHAAVPADVLDAACGAIFEPVAGALGDVEFAVRIVCGAVAAGLVV